MTLATPPSNAAAFKPRHVPALDGLRAIAVLMVVLAHCKEATPRWIWQVLHQGGFGVYLFFVLSGFLITRILLSGKNKPAYFRNFYARRTLRIFPLYYGVLALQFWVLLPIFPTPHILADAHYQGWLWAYGYNVLTAIKDHYFFTSDWMFMGHFWTLAVEEQFYLVWPFIVLALCRESLLKLCIGIVALTPILRLAFYAAGANRYWVTMFTLCQMDSLALGAMLACLESSGRLNAVVPMARRVVLGLGAILVICSFFYPRSPESTFASYFLSRSGRPVFWRHCSVGSLRSIPLVGQSYASGSGPEELRNVCVPYSAISARDPLHPLAFPLAAVGRTSLPGRRDLFLLDDHHHVPGRLHQLQCLRKTLFET